MNSNTIWKAILHKIRIDSKTRNASRSKNKLQRHAHLRLESLEDRWVPAYGIPNAIDLTATGETVDRGATTGEQSLSADGRYSVFVSSSTNLHVSNYSGTLSGISEVYTRDLHNGVTTLVSISPTGQAANNSSQNAVISADGRYVAFTSTATNLITVPSGYIISYSQIYVWDRVSGNITLASKSHDSDATKNLGANSLSGTNTTLSISDAALSNDGVVVAFDSYANNLDPSATVADRDINNLYAYTINTGNLKLVTTAATGTGGANANSSSARVSADGTTIAFTSYANNLDPNATVVNTSHQNIYSRKLNAAHAVLVSAEVANSSTSNGASSIVSQSLSGDGRYEVFQSNSTDLVVGMISNGSGQIFLRDRTTGSITLVSKDIADASAKTAANNISQNAVISADGRYVAFTSTATNLIATPSGYHISNSQVYIWDRNSGNITLASKSYDSATNKNLGANSAAGSYRDLSISDAALSNGGVVVAFDSFANNLDPSATIADTNIDNIYAYNISTGNVQLVTTAATGTGGGNANSDSPRVSANGTTIAFTSYANNLDPNATVANTSDQNIYARKLDVAHAVLVSAEDTSSSTSNRTSSVSSQSLSSDGRYEVFESNSTDLMTGLTSSGSTNIYLRDRANGNITLVSKDITNPTGKATANGYSLNAVISADGRYVAFTSTATNLITIPSGYHIVQSQVYVWDRTSGNITLASKSYDSTTNKNLGANSVTGSGMNLSISDASLSEGGVVVTFDSYANNLDPNATVANRNIDNIYAYNIVTGRVQLVSTAATGTGGANADSVLPRVSADGTTIAFRSYANNLDPNATVANTDYQNVYSRRLNESHVVLVSAEVANSSTSNRTSNATIQSLSSDGRYEVFQSNSTDLISGLLSSGYTNVYSRDRTTGSITLVSKAISDPTGKTAANNNSQYAVISADGRYIAFCELCE